LTRSEFSSWAKWLGGNRSRGGRGTWVAHKIDMNKALIAGLIISVFPVHSASAAPSSELHYEYISPEQNSKLEDIFNTARIPSAQDTPAVKDHQWTCDMYGVQTNMRVQRGVNLYIWKKEPGWHNEGAQVVNEYQAKGGGLVGQNKNLADEIRLTQSGQLVSRLSLASAPRTVIAYSVCKSGFKR
jgi:hypothetical protein